MIGLSTVAELATRIGQEVVVSDWMLVGQERIEQFADVTEDRQWIHVDPVLAAQSIYGNTIAHGFLTLSLVPALLRRAWPAAGVRMAVNYGLNRVRFVSPVPADSRIRGRFTPRGVETREGAIDVTWEVTIECEHGEKPCCVAEWIVRYYD